MKREHLFLEQMSDTQLGHTKRIVDGEVKRRSSAPAGKSKATKRGGNRRTAASKTA